MRFKVEYTHDGDVLARLFTSPKNLTMLSHQVRFEGMLTLEGDVTNLDGRPVPDITVYAPHIISISVHAAEGK